MTGVAATPGAAIDDARARLRAGDPAGARRVLDALDPDLGAVLECSARVEYLERDFRKAVDSWERAYAAYRATGDELGAIRVARTLGGVYGAILGEAAPMRGWLARAQTLAATADGSSERGWVALNLGMFEGDRARKESYFRDAIDVARRFGDGELELVALAYLGASLVHGDHTEEGMLLLDEALAAVAGSDVDDFLLLEEIFCQLFAACEHARDVQRADEWIRVGESVAARRRLPAVSAFCHTHYGGLLTAAGRWQEAEDTLTEAVRLWALGRRVLRGDALVRLADLRVRQGRYEEARPLLAGLEARADAARPIAAIELAAGDVDAAEATLSRALRGVDPSSTEAASLLALLVDVRLAAGDLDGAHEAAEALAACADAHDTDYLCALAALAQGQVCLATNAGDACACLRDALAGFGRAQLPMELARARLAFARALADAQPAVAVAEAKAALEAFEELRAARDADAAAAMLRTLGARIAPAKRRRGVLSQREEQVLDLLGHGLSNPEIAERLFISRKTVEHHVGSILTKLGLRSRAEAAAYAVRRETAAQ
jgi:DNA-binding NarL/FixJ family response regulator